MNFVEVCYLDLSIKFTSKGILRRYVTLLQQCALGTCT